MTVGNKKSLAIITIMLLTSVSSFGLAFAPSARVDASDSACSATNINLFADKDDVYIFGSDLASGNYYVEVTTPGGTSLGNSGINTIAVGGNGLLGCTQLTSIVTFGDSDNKNYKVRISLNSDFSDGVFDVFKVGSTTSSEQGSITLVKVPLSIYGGNNDQDSFGLTVDGNPVASGDTVVFDVPATVTIGEADPSSSGYEFVGISGTGCPATLTGSPLSGQVSLAAGDEIICIITNQDIQPSITLTKNPESVFGTEEPDDFDPSIDGNIVLSTSTTYVNSNTPIAIDEIQPNLFGYEFVDITGDAECPAVLGGTVILDEGENISCTITNHDTRGKIAVYKFYDINANGVYDNPTDPLITNWKVNVDGVDEITPFEGLYLPDDYVVFEYTPSQSNWLATTPTTVNPVTVFTDQTTDVRFGNVCTGPGGGLSKGFWTNKNGEAKINDNGGAASELALLTSKNLVNANGTPFNPATYAAFKTWLGNANAVNMSYMLSAQYAAMVLNVESGSVSGSSFIYAPGLVPFAIPGLTPAGFISIDDLMTAANNALGADGYTPAGDPNRAVQEALKNVLDNGDNNIGFVQQTPCYFSFAP